MRAELPLDKLQRWMQSVVVHPGDLETALSATDAQAELPRTDVDRVILPSKTLRPEERVGIYHGMYLLRMEEALATDYPGLKHFLGDQAFFELVRDYVQEHPSRSYTLNRLGDRLPDYVARAGRVKRRFFCADLARLELAVTQAFDAEETPCLSESGVAAVPEESWGKAVLQPVASLRLVTCRYNANDYLQSLKAERHDHPRPRLKNGSLAVFRRDYVVYRLELTRDAHALLADLAAGRPLGQAVAASLARGRRARVSEDDLFRWFRQWVGAGLFREVRV
jgi:hypothetical protein